MRSRSSLGLCLLLALASLAPSRAQEATPPPPPSPAPAAPVAPSRPPAARLGNIILVADRPRALYWAEGCRQPEQLPTYRATGLNTLVVEVKSTQGASLAAARTLAEAAGKQGLLVIVRLAPSPAGFKVEGQLLPPSVFAEAYRAQVAAFVTACVQELRSPAVAVWEVAAVDPDYLTFQRDDFLHYLQQWYGTMEAVNQAWGTQLTAEVLSDELVRRVDRFKPQGLGRATFDLVSYRQQRYADLLALWARELRQADPGRLVLAGSVRYYRSALAVPRDYDGMVLGFPPTQAEGDLELHNPHAVDIGRRGNRFAALPVLLVGEGISAAQLRTWTLHAAAHGAAGVGYGDWQWLQDHPDLRGELAGVISQCRQLELAPRTPACQVAMLCEPLAAGALAGRRSLYGHIGSLSVTEPGGLVFALRSGCRFGILDFLSLEDVEQAEALPYRLLLAPLALQMSDRARVRLVEFMQAGGVLFGDGECGRFGAPGQPERPGGTLEPLFGVRPAGILPGQVLPIVATFPHPLFPSLGDQQRTLTDLTTCPFTNDLTWVYPLPGTQPVIGFQQNAPACAGLLARPVGKGWALYASGRVWESWLPGRPYFDDLMTDILGRDYDFALAWPGQFGGGPTVVRYREGELVVLGAKGEYVTVLTRAQGGQLFSMPGGVQSVRAGTVSPLTSLWVPAQPVLSLRPIPVKVTPAGSQVLVQVAEYTNKVVRLVAFGEQSQVTPGAKMVVVPAGITRASFTVHNGVYPIAPGSKHHLKVESLPGEYPLESDLAADASGVLRFEVDCDMRYITLTPAP